MTSSITPQKLLALSPEQKRFFDENGYLLVEELYSPAEVTAARQEMARLLRDPEAARPRVRFSYEKEEAGPDVPVDPDNPRRVWMVMDTPLAGDWWFDNIRDPRVVDIIADLLGPNIDFHNGKARIKPPGYVSHQGWHQDWPYERHSQPDLCAAILYLDDTAEDAASTRVVPGSHRRGEWPHDEHNIITDEAVGTPGVPLCARAGDVAFIHVLVVHRAGHNATDRNRSCIINEYKTMEALDRWGNPCAFAGLPLCRGGQRVG
jgi:ectoine hydroxylase-related dioxygenase (phytanoyl-CoA dioxygenase family)